MTEELKVQFANYQFNRREVERTFCESNKIKKMSKQMQYFEQQQARKKLIDLRKQLVQVAKHKDAQCRKIERMINRIPDEQIKELFSLRYLKGYRWDDISEIMNYEIDSKAVFKLHKSGLSLLKDKYKPKT